MDNKTITTTDKYLIIVKNNNTIIKKYNCLDYDELQNKLEYINQMYSNNKYIIDVQEL